MSTLAPLRALGREVEPRRIVGSVSSVRGPCVLVDDMPMPVGAMVAIAGETAEGEIVGFEEGRAIVMLLDMQAPIAPGMPVEGRAARPGVMVGDALLGRVLDGRGQMLDGGAAPVGLAPRPLHPAPLSPLDRAGTLAPLATGVRVVDGMLTLGCGQRIGVFAGPGIGKSTLLASVARHTAADVNVVALIGERGREVREFLHRALEQDARARTVAVVATSDEAPVLRLRAAFLACAVAEHFRDQGADVMLVMDSLTRLAHAQRQIGLAAGEPPTTKGYPPSVFAMLPRVVERAGALEAGGSITGLFTVLVEGDDPTEPIADAARGVLDGHIMLSRTLAARGHFPPVDVLESVSRLADEVTTDPHRAARDVVRRALAARDDVAELVQIGAYARGADRWSDAALAETDALDGFLRQRQDEQSPFDATVQRLLELGAALRGRVDTSGGSGAPS